MRTIDALVLKSGGHSVDSGELCAMEAVAWLANEKHSDDPECACPVIGAYVRCINDSMDDENRQRLKAYLPRIVGSRNEKLVFARSHILTWVAIRVFAPVALESAGFKEWAEKLRNVPQGDLKLAEQVAREAAANAASYASYTANAAAYAANAAAYAAAAAANAAAVAALTASYAATYAASAASAKSDKIWDLALLALDQALSIEG